MQLHIPVSLFCKLKILYYISSEDTVVGPAFHLYANNINIEKNFFQRIVLLILAIANYRIYSINRPGRLLNFWTLRVGAYSRLGAY